MLRDQRDLLLLTSKEIWCCYNMINHHQLLVKLNNINITRCFHQKHLGIVLNSKLNFNTHVAQKIKKCNKLIGLMKRLSINLPRNALLTIYKSFVRPHLDYGNILYDNPNNKNFQSKLEKGKYNACLAVTGAIKGTSRERLYNE